MRGALLAIATVRSGDEVSRNFLLDLENGTIVYLVRLSAILANDSSSVNPGRLGTLTETTRSARLSPLFLQHFPTPGRSWDADDVRNAMAKLENEIAVTQETQSDTNLAGISFLLQKWRQLYAQFA